MHATKKLITSSTPISWTYIRISPYSIEISFPSHFLAGWSSTRSRTPRSCSNRLSRSRIANPRIHYIMRAASSNESAFELLRVCLQQSLEHSLIKHDSNILKVMPLVNRSSWSFVSITCPKSVKKGAIGIAVFGCSGVGRARVWLSGLSTNCFN
jgi:hypothetical protein